MRRILALLLTVVMALSLVVVASATAVTEPGTVDLVITTAETEPESGATELVYYVYLKPQGNAEVGAAQFTLTAPEGASFKNFDINENYVYNDSGTGFGKENGIFALGMMTDTSGDIGGHIEERTFKAVLAGTVREITGSLTKRMLASDNCSDWLYKVTLKVPAFNSQTDYYALTASDVTAGFNANSSETTDVRSVTVKHAVNVTSEGYGTGGVTVSGKVTSYGSSSDDVTVTLTKQGDNDPAYTTGATNGSYAFTDVVPGTYTMKVAKKNHVTREYTVTVAAEDVTQDAKIHLLGDINGDGSVDMKDWGRMRSHINKTNMMTDDYALACADVTKDGSVDMKDWGRMRSHINKANLLW